MGKLKVFAKPTLRKMRMAKGYNLETFSKLIGYSFGGYAKVETCQNGTRPKCIKNVLEVLEVEFDEVFEFKEVE